MPRKKVEPPKVKRPYRKRAKPENLHEPSSYAVQAEVADRVAKKLQELGFQTVTSQGANGPDVSILPKGGLEFDIKFGAQPVQAVDGPFVSSSATNPNVKLDNGKSVGVLATTKVPSGAEHYYREVHTTHVDVYRVLEMFEVTDPAVQHAIKKLLAAGRRGRFSKDKRQDLVEAGVSIQRAIAMFDEDY